MPHVRRLRMSNPRKRRSRNSRRKTRRNPVGEVLIVANPRKRRSKKSYRRSKASRRSNPFRPRHHVRRRGHRRSNPGIAGFNSKELLSLALGAGAGVVASKYVTQLALGDNNSGVVGYAGTAVVVIGLGWAAHKFVGKDAATGVVAGGLGALALRIFQEQVSLTSAAAQVSGLGDPDMRALGVGGLGDYKVGSMPMPSMFVAPAPIAAPAPARRRG